MKKLIYTSVIALLFAGVSALTAQNMPDEYLGLPGDNLNLYAVMNLFQESETLESFERSLNESNTMINNLDLNGDNLVDYIMVFDYKDNDIHNIVLRVALNQSEYQDVAVFTVQKFRDGSVQIQLIGDEALYGPNYIVEPIYAETPNPGYRPNTVQQRPRTQQNVTVVRTTYYEVASWPVVTYIYRPSYRVYRSSWRWGYNPTWWNPWTPHYWHYYYGYHYNWHTHYYAHYRPWNHHRCVGYHTVYHSRIRHHSPKVVVMVNNGSYKNTYSRPDKRREGEVLYNHRHNSGSTVPSTNRSLNSTEGRRTSVARTDANERVARSNNHEARTRSSENNNSRPQNAVRQNPSANRNATSTVNATRGNREAAVQNNAVRPNSQARQNAEVNTRRNNRGGAVQSSATPVRTTTTQPARSLGQPARERVTSAPSRGRSPEPTRNTSSTVVNRNLGATQGTPSNVTNRAQSQPSKVVRPSTVRSGNQPETRVRSSVQNNNSRNTAVATPGNNNRRSSNTENTSTSRRSRR